MAGMIVLYPRTQDLLFQNLFAIHDVNAFGCWLLAIGNAATVIAART